MKIKTYPSDLNVHLGSIDKGECFMLLTEIEPEETLHDYGWCEGEIFIKSEYSEKNNNFIRCINLEDGSFDELHENLVVRKIKAYIVCE